MKTYTGDADRISFGDLIVFMCSMEGYAQSLLKAGTTSSNITPEEPIPMGG